MPLAIENRKRFIKQDKLSKVIIKKKTELKELIS